jgi:ATP-dependent Zn protease
MTLPGAPCRLRDIIPAMPYVLLPSRESGERVSEFSRSRARLLTETARRTTFDHVAGIKEPAQELKEIVALINNREKLKRLGGSHPARRVLVGPPGTGKGKNSDWFISAG